MGAGGKRRKEWKRKILMEKKRPSEIFLVTQKAGLKTGIDSKNYTQ